MLQCSQPYSVHLSVYQSVVHTGGRLVAKFYSPLERGARVGEGGGGRNGNEDWMGPNWDQNQFDGSNCLRCIAHSILSNTPFWCLRVCEVLKPVPPLLACLPLWYRRELTNPVLSGLGLTVFRLLQLALVNIQSWPLHKRATFCPPGLLGSTAPPTPSVPVPTLLPSDLRVERMMLSTRLSPRHFPPPPIQRP